MLELNDNTEKESRNCTNYEYNLLHQYEIKIMVMQFAIKKYGLQVFLGHEEPATEYKEDVLLKIPVEERREIYRFMERHPDYTKEQLAKVLLRESEYSPRW